MKLSFQNPTDLIKSLRFKEITNNHNFNPLYLQCSEIVFKLFNISFTVCLEPTILFKMLKTSDKHQQQQKGGTVVAKRQLSPSVTRLGDF